MSRTLKNIMMVIALVVMVLLLVVTIFKATDERVVVGSATGAPNGMGGDPGVMNLPEGTYMDENMNLIFQNGTIIYPNRTGVKADGTPLTQEEIDILMPVTDGGMMGTPPDGNMMGGGDAPMDEPMQTTINDLNITYYIYFGVEGLVIVLILGYLILSKFNAKGFNETFDETIKFILMAIIVIFGTAILTYASGFISDVWAEKLKEIKEADNKSLEENNPSLNQQQGGTMGTETTDPNAGVTPEGGENVVPEGNPEGMDPNAGVVPDGSQEEMVPGTQVQPGESVAPNENQGEMPPEGMAQPDNGNPGEGGGMPPQMP